MSKPDLTPVTDADEAVEESIRRTLSRVRSRDAVTGEEQGSTGHSQRRWIVDPIDGTKNFVRGVPGLGHADRAGRRRRGGARRGVGAAAAAALVGLDRQRRLDRPVAAEGDPVPGLRRTPARGRLAVLLLAARLGGARPARRLPLADAPGLADPRVRRLLVLHAARRGRRRPRRRAGARGLRHGGARRDRARGRRHVHLARRRPTARGAATRWPPTATCTTRRCRSWASVPDDDGDPDWQPSGPGSVSELRPRGPRPVDDRTPPRTRSGRDPES